MGTNQSSLASKNTTVENKSTLKSALFSGKRGRKEFQTSSDDLVIVEKPIVENKSAVGSVTDYEGSDSESDDEYGKLNQLTIFSFVGHTLFSLTSFFFLPKRKTRSGSHFAKNAN